MFDVRCENPLPHFVSQDEEFPVPDKWDYEPQKLGGFAASLERANNIPGKEVTEVGLVMQYDILRCIFVTNGR